MKPEFVGAPDAPTQNNAVLTALRVFVSLVPVVILLVSYGVVRLYPITRAKHAEIQAQLGRVG